MERCGLAFHICLGRGVGKETGGKGKEYILYISGCFKLGLSDVILDLEETFEVT